MRNVIMMGTEKDKIVN